jgi:hypothetical protein
LSKVYEDQRKIEKRIALSRNTTVHAADIEHKKQSNLGLFYRFWYRITDALYVVGSAIGLLYLGLVIIFWVWAWQTP